MNDTQLYSQVLGITKPWQVIDVKVSLEDNEVEVRVEHQGDKHVCPLAFCFTLDDAGNSVELVIQTLVNMPIKPAKR